MGNHGVVVSGGNTSLPYVNQNVSNPMQGMIRIWGTDVQVFDGNSWMNLNTSYATVGMDHESQIILNWARHKMLEEQELQSLMEKHPGLKDAKDRFEIMLVLVKEYKDHELK